MIGTAASALLLLNGRIACISSILGGLLCPVKADIAWRIAFLAGLMLAPVGYALVASAPVVRIDAGTSVLVIAGLLVGVGTRYGSGCTSGHGVVRTFGKASEASAQAGCLTDWACAASWLPC